MLRSIGKQSGKPVESVLKKKRKATATLDEFAEKKALSLEWKSDLIDITVETILSELYPQDGAEYRLA